MVDTWRNQSLYEDAPRRARQIYCDPSGLKVQGVRVAGRPSFTGLGDHRLRRDDDYFFGVLHSSIHELWARAQGTQLREVESGLRYTPSSTFDTFTKLCNARPEWLANAHRTLDAAVFAADGWSDALASEISDQEILARLLALNHQRAAAQPAP